MKIETRVRSVKLDIDNKIESLKHGNTEVSEIILARDELENLALELGVSPQEVLGNGYNGADIFMSTIGGVFGVPYPAKTKIYCAPVVIDRAPVERTVRHRR